MDFKNFLELSEVTEKKFEDGMELTAVQAVAVNGLMNLMISLGKEADKLKKHLIYGKEIEGIDMDGEVVTTLTRSLTQEQAEFLHHVIGVFTEATELVEALHNGLVSGTIDKVNIQEEIGDLFWYIAGLLRLTGADPHKIMNQNIEKLKARYGEKFDAHAALNRDLGNERKVLEDNNAEEV